MCDTNAYVWNDGSEDLYLESVDSVRPENGSIRLRNLFGEEKVFEGRIREITLARHKILLER